jgi:hypothetical protein
MGLNNTNDSNFKQNKQSNQRHQHAKLQNTKPSFNKPHRGDSLVEKGIQTQHPMHKPHRGDSLVEW